ncbi:hypothetical protein ANCCAN_27603 [Ancylostoma caninum]|uniref:Uncharacterized protein n=1 Tax=Ancylostoma caninum TaxID=29170 RepID=A0A368F6S7_ANCCA|nr:hypothetical protein ANCCAN_27603 [Ancylostoma caninum]
MMGDATVTSHVIAMNDTAIVIPKMEVISIMRSAVAMWSTGETMTTTAAITPRILLKGLTYDSDGYRDVESPKTSATSSKQRQSSSHGNASRKRRHSSEEPEPAQHSSSSSKTPTKVTPSKKVVTEFDMILQSADSGQPKHKKREHHRKWSELPVLSNYQPFPQAVRAAKDAAAPPADDFNPENMFKPRNERGKVFAGRRKNVAMSVPSLFNLCLRVLCNNIGVLLYAEYIPYDVLKPVFEKCTVEEFASIESKHPVNVCFCLRRSCT